MEVIYISETSKKILPCYSASHPEKTLGLLFIAIISLSQVSQLAHEDNLAISMKNPVLLLTMK
jgi:hypothetical protein